MQGIKLKYPGCLRMWRRLNTSLINIQPIRTRDPSQWLMEYNGICNQLTAKWPSHGDKLSIECSRNRKTHVSELIKPGLLQKGVKSFDKEFAK